MTADTLLLSLAAQQRRILGILDGLSEDSLRRPVLPSGWSCAGMVSHLTAMTRFWFVAVMTGVRTEPDVDDDFHVPPSVSAASVLDTYRRVCTEAIAAVRELPLDTPPAWWPEGVFGDWRLNNFLEVLDHVLVETAAHAGHLDAARELLDGRTWDWEHGRLADPR
ncbi:mycothiol transferase [Actinopolymorpha cephalotaxi]|nr:DUF664 domain-containing protein [Actinopolymorpha cephalotaxi]NYH84358.1 putative damage-inducible protein DinB [Actinopolymorpha cephalotaxi]